jgi:hypothetical protein
MMALSKFRYKCRIHKHTIKDWNKWKTCRMEYTCRISSILVSHVDGYKGNIICNSLSFLDRTGSDSILMQNIETTTSERSCSQKVKTVFQYIWAKK